MHFTRMKFINIIIIFIIIIVQIHQYTTQMFVRFFPSDAFVASARSFNLFSIT